MEERKAKVRQDDEDEDDEMMMDISETKKCYVYGQCQVGRECMYKIL